MAERCYNADVVATTLLANNEEFAREMTYYARQQNRYQTLFDEAGGASAAEELLQKQIQASLETRILLGQAWWAEAKTNLIKQIAKYWGTLGEGIKTLEMIDNISLRDMERYAWLLMWEETTQAEVEKAIYTLKENVAWFVASKKILKDGFWIKGTKVMMSSEDLAESAWLIKRLKTDIWARWKNDKAKIKKWETPTEVLSPDATWKFINAEWGDDFKKRTQLFNNYALGRIFIAEDDNVFNVAKMVMESPTNSMPKLTVEDVNNMDSINSLVERVYTNIADIANDTVLAETVKNKLYQLMRVATPTSTTEGMALARSIVNTVALSEQWLAFTQYLKYDKLSRTANWLLTTIDKEWRTVTRITEHSASQLYKDFIKLLNDKKLLEKLEKGWVEFWWTTINWKELSKLLYSLSWDRELKQVLELSDSLPENVIIDFARGKLFWIDTEQATKNLEEVLSNYTRTYTTDELWAIAMKATSWVPVDTLNWAVFIDFTKENERLNVIPDNSPYMLNARFNDELAKNNTLTVAAQWVISKDSDLLFDVDKSTKYIIVPNASYANRRDIKKLKEELNAIVIYPRSGRSWQYFMEDWMLKFKTTDINLFDEMSNRLAAESFNQATVDLTINTPAWRDIVKKSREAIKQDLENSAADFWKSYLGLDDWLTTEQVRTQVSKMTGIAIDPENPSRWWKLAQDTAFMDMTWVGWFRKRVADKPLEDIVADIKALDEEWLIQALKNDGFIVNNGKVRELFDTIREAYINLKTTDNVSNYIWYKWIIEWLGNRWEANLITMSTLRQILITEQPNVWLARLFFWPRPWEYTADELAHMDEYLEEILDAFANTFANEVTKAWYSLPLIQPRNAILNYLKGNLAWDDFTLSFLYKNWMWDNYWAMKTLFDNYMPSNISLQEISADTIEWLRVLNPNNIVVETAKNDFMPTTYNSYYAARWNTKGKVAVKAKEWIISEDQIVENILNNYYKAVESAIKDWSLTFRKAQDLKRQAWYALDTAAQDILLNKYWGFLTMEERDWIAWLKYDLKLATNKEELKALKQSNIATLNRFRQKQAELAGKMNTYFAWDKEIEEQLASRWVIATNQWWAQVVTDVWSELERSINTIPETAWDLLKLREWSRGQIKNLAPKDAFVLIKTIDAVKNAITRWNFYTDRMYKLNPTLRNIDFFRNFKVQENWVPKALMRNATEWFLKEGEKVQDQVDEEIKRSITNEIKTGYIWRWVTLSQENLSKIVRETLISNWTDVNYAQVYIDAFSPFTNLQGIPQQSREYVNNLLKTQYEEISKSFETAWESIQDLRNLSFTMDDWSTITVWEMLDSNIDRWQTNLFWGEIAERYPTKLTEEESVDFMKATYAYFNDADYISANEGKAVTQLIWNARKILQRDTNTNRFVELDYIIWWQNDILDWLFTSNVFNNRRNLKGKKWMDFVKGLGKAVRWGVKVAWWWTNALFFNPDDWNKIRQLYEVYYWTPLSQLNKMSAPSDWIHQTAFELAKYFKKIEETLGSKDWALWVSTRADVNRAFGNLWGILKNVNSANAVFSLRNKIKNNQILGLFRFTKEWDASYNKLLKELWGDLSQSTRWYLRLDTVWRQEYINKLNDTFTKEFNQLFGSNFTDDQVKIIVQGLWGYNIATPVGKFFKNIQQMLSSSNRIIRWLMSYPFQLFTIAPQLFAYNVKADAFKKALWVEDLVAVKNIRKELWILEWEYVELPDMSEWLKKVFNRDSVDLDKIDLNLDDWVMWLYGKTTNHIASNYSIPELLNLWDSVRDNANNIIDAAMAQTFKNIAFVKALQTNNRMQFMNPQMFREWLNSAEVPQALKEDVLTAVQNYSGRIFKDMLGTWFSGMDKAYWAWAIQDFLLGCMALVNFKWARWMNIFRQTFEKAWTVMKLCFSALKRDTQAVNAITDYIAKSPEFTNLAQALWNDLVWSWKLAKFSDNGKIPDDEDQTSFLDFTNWIWENRDLVSQQWQGIESFWPARPFISAVEWAVDSLKDPDQYWPWYGSMIGSFVNTLTSNIWRNWKPQNLAVESLMVAERDWGQAWWDYLWKNFYKLSAWTMRYIVEEWWNDYWANTPLNVEHWGIPSLLKGNSWQESDTSFSYKIRQQKTWEYLKNMWEEWYTLESLWALLDMSQLLNFWRNIVKAWAWVGWFLDSTLIPDWAKSTKNVYNLSTIYDDIKDNYYIQALQNWDKVIPQSNEDLQDLVDRFVNKSYPWGYKAYDAIQNFKNTGHINWKKDEWKVDNWYYYDRPLEEFYTRIQEKDPQALDKFMSVYTSQFLWDPEAEEARVFTLAWAENWLHTFEWDPEYNKYAQALFKGSLNNLYYEFLDAEARRQTNVRKALWYSSAQAKVSRSDLKKNDDSMASLNREFVEAFYDKMYEADSALMQNRIFNYMAGSLDEDMSSKYFVKENKTARDWSETDEIEWNMQWGLKSELKQLISTNRAIEEWRFEDAITESSLLAKSLIYWDEDNLIRPALVEYMANRIQDSPFSPQMKISALAFLMDSNEDAFTYDSVFAEKYPEIWSEAKWYLNSVLYNVNLDVINNLNDLAVSLSEEWANSGSWSGSASLGLKTSAKLNNLSSKLGAKPSTRTGNITWIATPIKWLSDMGYTPYNRTSSKPDIDIIFKAAGYDPKTKTLWPKASSWQKTKNKAIRVKKSSTKTKDINLL